MNQAAGRFRLSEDGQVCVQKSAREQQHCWDSVGQKIFKNNKDSFTKRLITISYFQVSEKKKKKKKKKTKGKEKEALAVNGFILRALMKAEL